MGLPFEARQQGAGRAPARSPDDGVAHWPFRDLFVKTPPRCQFKQRGPRVSRGRRGDCMAFRRIAAILMALTIPALVSIGSASALDYPTHPVRFVVGYPAGGSTDIFARLIGQ